MRPVFDKEERRDFAQEITQASLAQWGMGKGNHPSDVRHKKEDREEETEVAALRLENAILKAEVDGLRATVAVLTTATRHLPCLRCGEIRAVPADKASKIQETHSLPKGSGSTTWLTPTRPPEKSGNHRTDVHSVYHVQPTPEHPPNQTAIGGHGQAQPTGSLHRVGTADSSHWSDNVAPVCAPAPAGISSSQPGDDSRTECALLVEAQVPLEAQVQGAVSESGAYSKRHSKSSVRCTSPREPGGSRLTMLRTEFCAKCWPLPTKSMLPTTARETDQETSGGDSWSQSSANHIRGKDNESKRDASTIGSRKTQQTRTRSLKGHTAPGKTEEIRATARVSGSRACRDTCTGESQGEALVVEPRLTPGIHFHANMKDVDEDEKFSHCTVCALCGLSPPEGNPLSLCRGCPRIFCSKCLPRKSRGAKPVKCPRCSRDEQFPPVPPGVEPMVHLLEQLIEHDLSHSFRERPEYMKTAVRSMNLSTMMDKLKSGKYSGRRAWGHFQKDCSLIWENCRYYNDCDELGLPEEGTVIPGVVRCALVLEAMTRRFYLSYLPDQKDSAAAKHLGSSPMDLQTWDAHRRKVQQAKAEERLKQVEGSQHNCSNRTRAASACASEMSGNAITAATGAISSGDTCSVNESTTGRSDAVVNGTARAKEKSEDSCFKQIENKRRVRAGQISTYYGQDSYGKQRAGRREMVNTMQRTNPNRPWNGAESTTSCDHVALKVGAGGVAGPGRRVDPNQVGQRALQPSRSVKDPSTGTDTLTTAAIIKRKRLSSIAQPAPAKRTHWMLLDQLGDVAYGFPKKRNK